jgi:hypothetical protein
MTTKSQMARELDLRALNFVLTMINVHGFRRYFQAGGEILPSIKQ